jgi:hypothetical protein
MRKENWAMLLAAFFHDRLNKPFKRSEHDCAVFVAQALEVMTGEDYIRELKAEAYHSKGEAKKVLNSHGFETLEDLATDRLGQPYENINFAKRGDVVSLHGEEGPALAIIDLSGRSAVTTGIEGLKFYPPEKWVKAWSVE